MDRNKDFGARPKISALGIRRRGFLQAAGGAAVVAGVGFTEAGAAGAASSSAVAVSASWLLPGFSEASRDTGALLRWWWPAAAVEHSIIREQLDQVADAGYRGVEIGSVLGVGGPNGGVDYHVDPDEFGFGTRRWIAAVEAALEHADRLGLTVDLCLGPHWNMAVPALGVDTDASTKEFVHGRVLVDGGQSYRGPVPEPAPRTYVDRTWVDDAVSARTKTAKVELIGAQAARCVSVTDGIPVIDLASVIDLTPESGALDWQAPAGDTWVIVGAWYRGTAMKPDLPYRSLIPLYTDPEAYVVDYFSKAGAQAFIEYFSTLLTPATRKLLRRTGGTIFDDSIEVATGVAQLWTPQFLAEFATRRGYALVPFLPALALTTDDPDKVSRVKRDVEQTFGELYLDHHVQPFLDFAHDLGLRLQAQPYGAPIDLALAATRIDVPEGENFAFTRRGSEDWRLLASGADLVGTKVLQDEYRPGAGLPVVAHESSVQDLVTQANEQFELGVTRLRMVGLAYPDWPEPADGSSVAGPSRWPGFYPLPPTIPEAMGPRNPTWTMESDVAGYFARTQRVLQEGVRRTDIAVYTQTLNYMNPGDIFDSRAIRDAGFTYGYLTPGTLAHPLARAAAGRVAPNGPAYRAVIIDEATSMPLEAAARLDAYAAAGVAVVIVGPTPTRVPGLAGDPDSTAQADVRLQQLMNRLVSHARTTRVATAAEIPQALAGLGVTPAVTSSEPGVHTVRRETNDTSYYAVRNSAASKVVTELELSGPRRAAVVAMNPWSGQVTPVASETRTDETYAVQVEVGPRAMVLLAVTTRGRARRPVSRVPLAGSVAVANWELRVDDWLPATDGQRASLTNHATVAIGATPLVQWSEISSLTDSSGVGTYQATVSVPAEFRQASGVTLDLGAVRGAFRVRVNGRWVGASDQLSSLVDLGSLLLPGRANTIEVDVATTLVNRLRVTRTQYSARARQSYGLLGPVQLLPYAERTASA